MRVCVPRESAPGESRVALTPEAAGKLGAAGFEIVVERGAGVLAGFPDGLYADAGAALSDHAHLAEGAGRARPRVPAERRRGGRRAARRGADRLPATAERRRRNRTVGGTRIVGFAMESIPRITRAQSMDALSSQATIAGYKAVLLAADQAPSSSR